MEYLDRVDVVLFAFAVIFALFLLFAFFWFTYWVSTKKPGISPYSGLPLRRGSDLSYAAKEKIYRMLYDRHEYDNRIFDINRAAVCRETGRIFPDAVNWFDNINVDWSFLKRRYPGLYVSWGSLTLDQQDSIRACHATLEGYQTIKSCPHVIPKMIEPEYAFASPGPLYVDFEKKVLLGWQVVPDTNLEVLIVQKPIK